MEFGLKSVFHLIVFSAVSMVFIILYNYLVVFVISKCTSILTWTAIILVLMSLLIWLCWGKYSKRNPSRQSNVDRELLMNALRSVETSKIPYVVDRFLELDRAGETSEDHEERVSQLPLDRRCVVCFSSEACIRTLPCTHCVVCGWCAWQSLKISFKQGTQHRCVICRTEIEDFTGSLIKNLMNIKWKDVRKIVDEIK